VIALENARLLEETQRSAANDRLVGQITARMRETLDVETVLRTTVDELYQTLQLDEVVIRLVTGETNGRSTD
jgi:GAF domain-containing protein